MYNYIIHGHLAHTTSIILVVYRFLLPKFSTLIYFYFVGAANEYGYYIIGNLECYGLSDDLAEKYNININNATVNF